MEKEFVPYELALRMKQLGFDEECFSYYDLNNKPNFFGSDNLMDTHCVQVNRPTFSQAFRWFREKYSYQSFISPSNELTYLAYDFTLKGFDGYFKSKQFKTYEEAELACLEKLIEIVEKL